MYYMMQFESVPCPAHACRWSLYCWHKKSNDRQATCRKHHIVTSKYSEKV